MLPKLLTIYDLAGSFSPRDGSKANNHSTMTPVNFFCFYSLKQIILKILSFNNSNPNSPGLNYFIVKLFSQAGPGLIAGLGDIMGPMTWPRLIGPL